MIDYNEVLNKCAYDLKPSGIRKYFDIVETMKDVISLGVGEPDFLTPWHIRQAGIKSLEQGKTRYTSNWGMPVLREAITEYMKRRFNLTYHVNQVLITVGGSEAIDGAIRAIISPGDEVIIPEPCFVCYDPITRLAGGVPVIIETKVENKFRITASELKEKITPKTKLLILPYPNNPTGAVMERQDLEEIAEIIRGTNILILSDEIYAELNYSDEKHVSISLLEGMAERCVVVSGFSKSYSMTGWRLGFACGPNEIISLMTKIHQFAIMSAPTTAQYAGIEAARNGDLDIEQMKEQYDSRRRLLVGEFNAMGLECFEPMGAFYTFPCIKSTGLTSDEFCEKLLFTQNVAVIPGTAFGECGEGFIRASYCNSIKHIKEALKRIKIFIDSLE